jgi:branched-chain amino acid transport system substrate-binding protein
MRRHSLARWTLAAAGCGALTLLQGCQPAEPVRIGFIGGLSGTVADLGVSGRNGAQLAVDTLNAQGKARYELIVEDDQQNPERARAAVASLSTLHASFVIGPMTSAMAMAAVPEADRLQLVMISPTATTHELSARKDHFFRVAPDAPAGARQLADVLFKRGARSLAVLMDTRNRSYSASFGGAAAQRFSALGGTVTAELGYESQPNMDFATLAQRLVDGKPDAVLLVDSPGDASLAAQQVRRHLPSVILAVSPWAANVQFMQFGGRAVEGTLALQAVDLGSEAPALVDFKHRYRERFGEDPATPAVQTYDAVMVGAEALRRRADKQSLREVLAVPGGKWPGLEADIVLDAFGDTDRALHMTEIRNGRFESIRP